LTALEKDIMMIPKEDHTFRVTVLVAVSPQFFGWITGIGTGIRINGPAEVQEEYREYLRKVMELYEDSGLGDGSLVHFKKENIADMEVEIDIDRLRRDIKDYYGTAMFNASPMAVMELSRIERMSDLEIVEEAQKIGVDLSDYIV